MRKSVWKETNIYEADNIKSPFVLGLISPKIFLPVGLSEHERRYILLHEQTHIRRYDHILKFVAYFILCLHWFNPLAWLAFWLMGADMEMSCDERVIKELGNDISADYSMSLIRIATGMRITNGSPLAFSEGGIKERVKRVMNFKKPSRMVIILSVVLVALLSVGFAINRTNANDAIISENPPQRVFYPREWVNYWGREMEWTTTYDILIDEFPDVMFSWTWERVTAGNQDMGVRELFGGWPVWNVFFADLNGDGFPELVATVSFGSGIVDTRIIVYDFANNRSYALQDRGVYDYFLSLEDGRLVVSQMDHRSRDILAVGELAIINDALFVSGIDRTTHQ